MQNQQRFIPVDTGSTIKQVRRSITSTVYPRGYGEHPDTNIREVLTAGLSPWIRGALGIIGRQCYPVRFIPVDTGSTESGVRVPSLSPVYPRGYGEHSFFDSTMSRPRGLSPWIRGALGVNAGLNP